MPDTFHGAAVYCIGQIGALTITVSNSIVMTDMRMYVVTSFTFIDDGLLGGAVLICN